MNSSQVKARNLIKIFVPNEHFLYPLKTSENRKVWGREKVHWERMD